MELFDLHCDTLVNYQEEGKDFLSEGTMFSLRNLPLFHRLCPDHGDFCTGYGERAGSGSIF